MDLHFDLHNVFASYVMEEFSHLANMPGSTLKFPYKTLVTVGPSYAFKPEHLELFDRVRREFVRRVDQSILQQQDHITSLKLDFLLGSEYQHIIDTWISCAIAKGAERIELFFSHRPYGVPNLDPYICSHTLFFDIKHLHLTNCLLLPHPKFSGFNHLKTLVLNELPVEKRLLSCLFSNCPHLEDLAFIDCQFNYAVNITTPTLHHLKLITSDLPWKIDIVTPNLSSFEYRGNILSISSIRAPHLTNFCLTPCSPCEELELQIPHAFALLASLPLLRSLSMFFSPSQVASLPRTIAPFQHLTEMELFFHGTHDENDDYLWVLDMVMACPRLQKLHFGIASPYLSANQRPRREHPGFSHSELKCVELHGCVGHTAEIELAGHFLKYVNSLEHITFGPRARIYLGAGEWMDGFDRPCWFSAGRNMAREELQDYVNGRTRLVFV